nr:PREDICTED: insulin-like growth factor-binding protein-like 1 [Rhinolophus sinicus]
MTDYYTRTQWVYAVPSPSTFKVSACETAIQAGAPSAKPGFHHFREPGKAVCGSDGRSYPSVCALRLRARHAPRAHPGHLHKARDGPCEFAPVVVIPPRSVHNVTGAQVYLSCEVRALPPPAITWRKVTQSPEGTQVLEDLPGDHVNIAVQVRGGPSAHEATAWILINPLKKEDEGVYQCHSTNTAGEAQSHGTVTVSDLNAYKAPYFPAPDDSM